MKNLQKTITAILDILTGAAGAGAGAGAVAGAGMPVLVLEEAEEDLDLVLRLLSFLIKLDMARREPIYLCLAVASIASVNCQRGGDGDIL